jgi:phosphoribosylformylglycinamidine synthase
MKFIASITIMPHSNLLDPQGKAVEKGLANMGFSEVRDVRVGKHISLSLETANAAEAAALTEKACKQLLANQVMETYAYTISEA